MNLVEKAGLFFGVILLMACGSGGSPYGGGSSAASQGGSAVSISNFAFSPNVLTVSAGSTVTWTNSDSVAHTSTSDTPGWDSGSVNSGQSFSFQFTTPGTFTYHCNVHPGMKATIVVQ